MTVLKEYDIGTYCSCKHKEKYKNCVGAPRRETMAALKKMGLSDKISPEINLVMIPLHCGQVTALLTCRLKKAKLLPMGE
jgi:hypothetical protein